MNSPKPEDALLTLSVVIPAHNEEGSIRDAVTGLYQTLERAGIPHEILVINDHSTDGTGAVVRELKEQMPTVVCHSNPGPGGYGRAVRYGLDSFTGGCVAIMMADMSDDPEDLVKYYRTLLEGYDCVFGSRFVKGGRTVKYPWVKLIINRMANTLVRILFCRGYNDVTNAFKLYRREVIAGVQPLLSPHFNLTLEMPLKAIVRGYSYAVVPNTWTNRKHGVSKLKIQEMGSRYLFIMLYCLIEKYFARGDYRKPAAGQTAPAVAVEKHQREGVD